jgi:hypothetical protein
VTFSQLYGLFVTLANVVAFLIVMACSILIWHKMRQSIMPEQQRGARVSRQVGRVLLLQALLPLILQTIPSTFFIFTAVIGHDVSFWSTFLNAQAWTSCMYPVATMAIIGHYRREIWKLVKSMRTSSETVSVYPTMA